MSPVSTNATIYCLLIRLSAGWSGAGVRFHMLVARRSEFGVAKSRLAGTLPWRG